MNENQSQTSLSPVPTGSVKQLVRWLSAWAWRDEIRRLEWELDDAKRHVKSMQTFVRDSTVEPDALYAEITKLKRLLWETRMTFRRLKGRPESVDFSWPHLPNGHPLSDDDMKGSQ